MPRLLGSAVLKAPVGQVQCWATLGTQRRARLDHRVTNHPALPGTGGFPGCMIFSGKPEKALDKPGGGGHPSEQPLKGLQSGGGHVPGRSVTAWGKKCLDGVTQVHCGSPGVDWDPS